MGGVVEGVALQAFLTSLAHASVKLSHFKPRLDRLKATLLLIHHQNCFNQSILPREAKAFSDLLFKAQRLVENCSNVKWNVLKRLYYAYKLTQLESSLLRFFHIDVATLHYVETKNISMRMTRLEDRIDEMASVVLKVSDAIKLPSLRDDESEQQVQVAILGRSSPDVITVDPHRVNSRPQLG